MQLGNNKCFPLTTVPIPAHAHLKWLLGTENWTKNRPEIHRREPHSGIKLK